MKCKTCRELMMAYLKEELDDPQRSALEGHLEQCVECRKELEGVRKVLSLVDAADQPGIRRLVNEIISGAIAAHASDIHIEPRGADTAVRYRIDGVLHDVMQIPKEQHQPIVIRIKQMAGMDVVEQKFPQGGRLSFERDDRRFDLRTSSLPTVQGESVVIRILAPPEELPGIEQIGMSEHNRGIFGKLLRAPTGLVFVTGPIGAGKTITLYAALREVKVREHSIWTVEDPVQAVMDGINQIQVGERGGLDHAAAMRYLLRQDPDVVLCDQIRNLATLQAVVTVGMTGHLVLAGMHVNSAVGVLRRLADVGLEPYLIAEAVVGAVCQRLLRKVCGNCRQQRPPTHEEIAWLQESGIEEIPEQLWTGAGCDECRQTGYYGRAAVHEVLVVDEEIRTMLHEDVDMDYIEKTASRNVVPMRYDAADKVVAGITDAAEAMRIFRHITARDN